MPEEYFLYELTAKTATGIVSVKLMALTDASAVFTAYDELKELGYEKIMLFKQEKGLDKCIQLKKTLPCLGLLP